jgi:phage pi2 protein 07
MASFYNTACRVDAKMALFQPELQKSVLDEGLTFYVPKEGDEQLSMPQSIMNDNVAVNYRTIYNGYPTFENPDDVNFTDYDDYKKCMSQDEFYNLYLQDKQNPTYKNILKYYSDKKFDPYGLASYRMQDFIYLKYYNQIPNNYMITLRRYTHPCEDHMFGLDITAEDMNFLNGYEESHFNIATAVTYMGEKAGNKLSDILKFEYGANYEEKEAKAEMLQHSGGLVEQMRDRFNVPESFVNGEATVQEMGGRGPAVKTAVKFAILTGMRGKSVQEAIAARHRYEGNEYAIVYGENIYGDVNVVNKTKVRSRGLTYSGNFSLNFEYSLKSLKCVNPRVAMMDILSNFLILTGNYGAFWGGETRFYGQRSIGPQLGDAAKLRNGDFKGYFKSLLSDVKYGFENISLANGGQGDIWSGIKNIASGALQGLLGNLLGGNVGIAGSAQVSAALLSGEPTGYWHVTVGNPLDPIAMMGNMAVTKTTVQFNDVLGYDDFPTEIKFTVDLEHCMPRDNAAIENMFNGAKGRFYSFTDGNLLNEFVDIDSTTVFQPKSEYQKSQQIDIDFDSQSRPITVQKLKVIAANLGK